LHYPDLTLGTADEDDPDRNTTQRLLQMCEQQSAVTPQCTRGRWSTWPGNLS